MFRLSIFSTSDVMRDKFVFYRRKIQHQLDELNVSSEASTKVLAAIDKIPLGHIQLFGAGALAFLTELTNQQSRCEEHYRYSDNLAEFFCTITNVGFFVVACYYQDNVALLAGTFMGLKLAIC